MRVRGELRRVIPLTSLSLILLDLTIRSRFVSIQIIIQTRRRDQNLRRVCDGNFLEVEVVRFPLTFSFRLS